MFFFFFLNQCWQIRTILLWLLIFKEILHHSKPVEKATIRLRYVFFSWLTMRTWLQSTCFLHVSILYLSHFGNSIWKQSKFVSWHCPRILFVHGNKLICTFLMLKVHLWEQNLTTRLSMQLLWMNNAELQLLVKFCESCLTLTLVISYDIRKRWENGCMHMWWMDSIKCWLNTGDSSIEGHVIEWSVRVTAPALSSTKLHSAQVCSINRCLVAKAGATSLFWRYRSVTSVYKNADHNLEAAYSG